MMTKKEKLDVKAFSLWVKHGKFKQRVDIPLTKRGFKGKIVGGKQTYLMAIDDFTTKFSGPDELINYIRDNDLAKIKTCDNNEVEIIITYDGPYHFDGNLSVIYNDNEELNRFLSANPVKGIFESLNPYVYNFQKSIIENWKVSPEYRMFMTDSKNIYYDSDLPLTLDFYKDEILTNDNLTIGPTMEYHNIRGNCLANKNLKRELQKIEYNRLVPFNEKKDYEEDKVTKPTVSNIRIINLPKKNAKIKKETTEQMALFNAYDYEEDYGFNSGNLRRG